VSEKSSRKRRRSEVQKCTGKEKKKRKQEGEGGDGVEKKK
jgi:hypothetical protein